MHWYLLRGRFFVYLSITPNTDWLDEIPVCCLSRVRCHLVWTRQTVLLYSQATSHRYVLRKGTYPSSQTVKVGR